MNDIKIYTVPELAKLLQLTPQSVRAYIKSGRIQGIKAGNKWVVSEDAVKAFLRGE